MCGIWLYLGLNSCHSEQEILEQSKKLLPRGPDRNIIKKISFNDFTLYMVFYRLAIMDLSEAGDQPFCLEVEHSGKKKSIYLLCNGEIYNYKFLVDKYNLHDKLKSKSDCEVLIHLYAQLGIEKLYQELNSDDVSGEFAMLIVEITDNLIQIHSARDMGGVRPLYECRYNDTQDHLEAICFSSQLCAIPYINKKNKECEQFSPYSHKTYSITTKTRLTKPFFDFKLNYMFTQHKYSIRDFPITIFEEEKALTAIRETLIKCVDQRMHADREIMFMCSGGLDSSLCAGIGAKFAAKHGIKINTMCIGLEGGTDEKYARMVADHIKSKHTHVICSEDEFLDLAKNKVVSTVESYDITTIRASTPQLASAVKIKENTDCKVVIIGDYSDEICGGYNETKLAPDVDSFKERIYELVENIHYFDSQRADRCIASNGLEARTPFGDHRFIQLYLSIDPKLRQPRLDENGNLVEKYLLRKAFDGLDFIPQEVLWRPKEAFSDGVSSLKKSWFQIIQADIDKLYDEADLSVASNMYKFNTPYTKESLHYRIKFCEEFSNTVSNVIPYFWLPKWGNVKDPSARVLSVYKQ
jgi:asparagine synthase (glutamine-hydrolysing)